MKRWHILLAWSLVAGPSVAGPNHMDMPTASVSEDGRAILVLKTANARPVRVPVIDRCGAPSVGHVRIRNIQLQTNSVVATYGKHCQATVSLRTLAITCNGCD